jgi:peptide/nickel transport system substrate-binding protein
MNPMHAFRGFRPGPLRVLAIVLAMGLVATACGDGDDSGDTGSSPATDDADNGSADEVVDRDEGLEPQAGGTLVFAVEADSDGYHPVDNRWSISGNYVGSAIYEPLLVEAGDGSLDAWLAESVTPNDDATEWTIEVREGIEFHDGTPLDAAAVALNVEARRDGALTGLANEPIEDVEIIDDMTVLVTMNRPWAAYDHSLAAVGGYVAAPSMLEAGGDRTAIIGTGPFTFQSWTPDRDLVVERHDGYWREPAHLEGIEFRFLPDVGTRALSLRSGDADAIITPQPEAIKEFRANDDLEVIEHASEPFHVLLNSQSEPFSDPLARQILAYATDADALISVLDGDDVLTRATSAFVPSNPWHLEDNGYPDPDRERAQELHDEWEETYGGPLSFELNASAGQDAALAGALTQQWATVGVDVDFREAEQSTFLFDVITGDYQSGLWRNHNWVDPDFNYIFWHSDNSNPPGEISTNFTALNNPDLDDALERGRATLDREVRREAYDEVQRLLNEELTHIWLYEQVWALASKDEVRGWGDLVDRGLSRLDPKVVWADVWIQQ